MTTNIDRRNELAKVLSAYKSDGDIALKDINVDDLFESDYSKAGPDEILKQINTAVIDFDKAQEEDSTSELESPREQITTTVSTSVDTAKSVFTTVGSFLANMFQKVADWVTKQIDTVRVNGLGNDVGDVKVNERVESTSQRVKSENLTGLGEKAILGKMGGVDKKVLAEMKEENKTSNENTIKSNVVASTNKNDHDDVKSYSSEISSGMGGFK